MNARHPIGIHATSPQAIERAAQLWSDRQHSAFEGAEALDELTFQQLLDLQDESSEDDSWDTFNDVARELKSRRTDAKTALAKLFVEQAKVGGMVPMTSAGELCKWLMSVYLTESVGVTAWASMMADVLVGLIDRDRLIAAMATEYANEQAEDLLRAGWTE